MAFDVESLRAEVCAEFEGRDVFDRSALEELGGFQVEYPDKDRDGHVNRTFDNLAHNRHRRKVARENRASRKPVVPIVTCAVHEVICPKCGNKAELREGSLRAQHYANGKCGGFWIKGA